MNNGTIAAVATPPGTGGVAVIRISGKDAPAVLRRVFSRPDALEHAKMVYGDIVEGQEILDSGYAVLFCAPRSYTGEDTAELHCHGGAAGVVRVLSAVLKNGARVARPGEFTKRAFLNGKLDLTQAEAVGDFIAAAGEKSARVSLRQMRGDLKSAVLACQDKLTDVLAETEAAVEYPEENLEGEISQNAIPVLAGIAQTLSELEKSYHFGKVVKDGFEVAIAGKPNVGKSSLLNALLGFDRAIVAEQPGTTRDTVEHPLFIDGIQINLMDTAGIRDTDDLIEQKGIERSNIAAKQSDLTIFVLDPTQGITAEDDFICERLKEAGARVLGVINKVDLSEGLSEKEVCQRWGEMPLLCVSSLTGAGVGELKKELARRAVPVGIENEGLIITNARQQEALQKAIRQIDDAMSALGDGMDMDCVVIDLNAAWQSLGELTGNTVSEEIIGRIFEKFCLGK